VDRPDGAGASIAANRLAAAQALAIASRRLVRLGAIRGAGHRTRRQMARAGALLLAAAALLADAPAAAVEPRFAFPRATKVALLLAKPAYADLDGDGDPELYVGTYSGSILGFRAGERENPFGLGVIASGSSPAFADLDDDGDLDALIGTAGGVAFFQPNTGSATAPAFAAAVANPFGLQSVPSNRPALADIDADGDVDVFIGGAADGGVQADTIFFENTGSASAPAFAAPSANPFGLASVLALSSPAFADLDGDGDLDAVIGDYAGETLFFRNTGSATAPAFAAPLTTPFGLISVGLAAAPAFADVNRDGDLDAVIGDAEGRVHGFHNTLPNRFGEAAANPFGLVPLDRSRPAFGRLDGDLDLDLLVGESSGDLVLFHNDGSNNFPFFSAPTTNPFGLANVGRFSAPALADLDSDGDFDALVGSYDGDTYYFENTGTYSAPAFAPAVVDGLGLTRVGPDPCPAIGDLDGDGRLDILLGQQSGELAFFRNTGTGAAPAFAAAEPNPFGLTDVGASACPGFAGLDGDGDLDVFVGAESGDIFYFENTATADAPSFAAPVVNPFELANAGFGSRPTFGDIDFDGDIDLLVGNAAGDLRFFENQPPLPPAATRTATGTPTPTHTLPPPTTTATTSPTATGTPTSTSTATPTPTDTATAPCTATATTTAAHTATATPVATEAPSGSPTPPGAPCAGDCNRSGEVGIDELVRAVGIALGNAPLDTCAGLDADASGAVEIGELIRAVRSALDGCPP
jgi:hypothetical protein